MTSRPDAGVLGKDVDGALAQRREDDLGAAQPEPPRRRDAPRLEDLREQLGRAGTTRRTAWCRRRPGGPVGRSRRRLRRHVRRGQASIAADTARRRRDRALTRCPRPNRARSSSAATYGVAGCATSTSGRSTWARRPWCSTATRSASSAASCRSWVTSSVVSPDARRRSRNIVWRSLRVMASSAPNGSSSSSVRAPAASARANATRCRCPPDSSCGQRAANCGGGSPTSVQGRGRGVAGVGPAEQPRHQRHVAGDAPVRQQAAVLRHVAERAPYGHRVFAGDVTPVDAHRAGVDRGQAR